MYGAARSYKRCSLKMDTTVSPNRVVGDTGMYDLLSSPKGRRVVGVQVCMISSHPLREGGWWGYRCVWYSPHPLREGR